MSRKGFEIVEKYFKECLESINSQEDCIEEVNKRYQIGERTLSELLLIEQDLSDDIVFPFDQQEVLDLEEAPEKEVYSSIDVGGGLSIRCKMPLRCIPNEFTTTIFVPEPLRDDWVMNVSPQGTALGSLIKNLCERVGYFLEEKDARIYCKLKHGVVDDESMGLT